MLEESKITDADLKLQNDFRVYIDRTLNAIKVIKETSALSEKEMNCTQNIGQIRGIQAIDCIFSR